MFATSFGVGLVEILGAGVYPWAVLTGNAHGFALMGSDSDEDRFVLFADLVERNVLAHRCFQLKLHPEVEFPLTLDIIPA